MQRIDRIARYGTTVAVTGVMVLAPTVIRPAAAATLDRLDSVVADAVEASPGRDSSDYSPPSQATVDAIVGGVSDLVSGRDAEVDAYDLVGISDAPAAVSALVEAGDPHAGNGLYAAREDPDEESPLIVEVPHAVSEEDTARMGAQLFSETESRIFMMAGAHRTAGGGSADVAHREDTAFAAVNDAVVSRGTTVVQLHGFSAANHETDLGDVVVSSAVDDPSPAARRLGDDLSGSGFDACVYDGENCKELAGTANLQAKAAHARGAEFIHIEVNQDIRRDSAESRRIVEAIGESLKASGIG